MKKCDIAKHVNRANCFASDLPDHIHISHLIHPNSCQLWAALWEKFQPRAEDNGMPYASIYCLFSIVDLLRGEWHKID